MKKRYFLPLLAALLLFSLLTPVFAEETDTTCTTEPTESGITAEARLEAALIAACRYGETLDITEYDITVEELDVIFHRLYDEGQFPWYVTNTFQYEYREWGDRLHALRFIPTLLEAGYDRLAYEQAVQELLQSCNTEGLKDWQKALVLHDALILRCRYDTTLQKNTGYDLLLNGTTVCAGYAALYQDLLQRVGIPSVVVTSEAMKHAWNLVQLEGNWYHVDVTWDDPTADREGRVRHDHFLRTDREIGSGEKPHYEWNNAHITCTDESYSDGFWLKADTQIIFTDKNTCYYGSTTENLVSIFRRTVSKDTEKRIYEEADNFLDIGEGRRRYYHTGLFLRDNRLWLCTMEKVLSIKTDGKSKKTEFTYSVKENNKYIGGFRLTETGLLLQLNDLTDTVSYQEEALWTPPHTHSYTLTQQPPTCAAEGYTLAVCDCGIRATAEFVKPQDHSWEDWGSKKATFKEDGYVDRICTVCGYEEQFVQPRLETGSWLRTHWYAPVLALLGLALVINLIALLTSFKRK